MITVPIQKPAKIKNNATDFGTTAAQAIWRDIIRAMNWYDKCLPVGIIMSWYQSQRFADSGIHPGGDPIPFPSLDWKFCDGSIISEALSPLNGQNVPDFRNRFLKHGSTIGSLGGNGNLDLRHYHTVASEPMRDAQRLDFGGERGYAIDHYHTISTDLFVANNIPPYVYLQYYIKINGGASINYDPAIECPNSPSFSFIDDSLLTKFGQILSVEYAINIKSILDYLDGVMQIGSIWPIMTNIPGVSVDTNIFQECNGSLISVPTSPLKGSDGILRYTPNLTNRYVKLTASLGQVGNTGGIESYNFNHSHGGRTGDKDFGGDDSDTDVNLYTSRQIHSHAMSAWVGAPEGPVKDLNPPFYVVKYFMKIQ